MMDYGDRLFEKLIAAEEVARFRETLEDAAHRERLAQFRARFAAREAEANRNRAMLEDLQRFLSREKDIVDPTTPLGDWAASYRAVASAEAAYLADLLAETEALIADAAADHITADMPVGTFFADTVRWIDRVLAAPCPTGHEEFYEDRALDRRLFVVAQNAVKPSMRLADWVAHVRAASTETVSWCAYCAELETLMADDPRFEFTPSTPVGAFVEKQLADIDRALAYPPGYCPQVTQAHGRARVGTVPKEQ